MRLPDSIRHYVVRSLRLDNSPMMIQRVIDDLVELEGYSQKDAEAAVDYILTMRPQ